jgi:hypothetical protein
LVRLDESSEGVRQKRVALVAAVEPDGFAEQTRRDADSDGR